MTFEALRKKGLKKLFLKNENEIEYEKWELLGHFVLNSKNKGNFKITCVIDIKIYYYDDKHCYVELECSRCSGGRHEYITIQEIIKYEYFFTHDFEVEKYLIE